MADYITKDNLKAYISENDLTNITKTFTVGSVEKNNVDEAIKNRCAYANTLLANRYKVPFAENDNHITDAFKAAISHLVLYDLLTAYDSISDNELQIRKDNAKNADLFLKDIRDGKQDLITELNLEGAKTDRFYFNSDKRIDGNFH